MGRLNYLNDISKLLSFFLLIQILFLTLILDCSCNLAFDYFVIIFLSLAAAISVGVPLAASVIAFVAAFSSEFLDREKVQQLFSLLVGELGKFRRLVVAKLHISLGASSSLEISSKSRYVCIFLFFATLDVTGHAGRRCATAFSKSASIPLASLEMAATLAKILGSVQPSNESKRICTLVIALGICSVMCSEAFSIST